MMGIYLRVSDETGKEIWHSSELGSLDRSFRLDGKESRLSLCDIDGDGCQDIVTAAFYGPRASGMYVFMYDKKTAEFSQVAWHFDTEKLTRDLLVADLPAQGGEDLQLTTSRHASALGMIYSGGSEELPRPGRYEFQFENGRFVHKKTQPLSTQ